MEAFATDGCLLVLGNGKDIYPFRKQIWEKVMDAPCQSGGFQSLCAENYLITSGRNPVSANSVFTAHLDIDAGRIETYFRVT